MQAQSLSQEAYIRVVYALEFTDREDQLQTSEEVHLYALSYNWDDGDESMRRLIDHPEIDAGTVLVIYWRANPQFFCQYATRDEVPDWARSCYDLIKEIERRFIEGFYTRRNFHYDPKNDGGVDITQEGRVIDIKQPIPEIMYAVTPGVSIAWGDPYDALSEADWERLNADIEADDAQEML
jgi:uncharacterized protein DUF4274